jgi:sugar phosphate isomerase/epimerase
MQRRSFLAGAFNASVAAVALGRSSRSWRFDPCLNEATTLNAPFADDCKAYAAAGFKHIELWFEKLRKQNLAPAQVRKMLGDHGLSPVSACASEGRLWRQQANFESHLDDLRRNFEMAQALGVPRYVIFSYTQGQVAAADYQFAAERFVKTAELAAPYHLRIAFEFIARSSLFGSLITSLQMLRAAGQPNAGICLDTFHLFAGVSKVEDLLQLRPGEVEHVHFHDVPGTIPREMLTDPDRIPPDSGVIPLHRVTGALRRIGYQGNLSTELFGKKYQDGNPWDVARVCFNSLERYCKA